MIEGSEETRDHDNKVEGGDPPQDVGGRHIGGGGSDNLKRTIDDLGGLDVVIRIHRREEKFGDASAARQREKSSHHLVEGAAETGIHHQREAEAGPVAIGIEGQAGEIRDRSPNNHDDEEKQKDENRDGNVGLKTLEFNFKIFNLNAKILAGFVGVFDQTNLGK